MTAPFQIRPCGPQHLELLLAIEQEALACLERPDLLRRNSQEMWEACLRPPHVCIGAWKDNTLAGFAVLFVPQPGDSEDLAASLTSKDCTGLRSANFKICIVRPLWRGHGLQVLLGTRLEEEARQQGFDLLCATASPHNPASIKSLEHLGYHQDHLLTKYGFERILFYKRLAVSR